MAPEFGDSERPPIKITDKRRIRDDDAVTAPADEAGAASGEPTPDADAADSTADIDAARAEAAEYLDHLRRLQAEFDNYRKRVLQGADRRG